MKIAPQNKKNGRCRVECENTVFAVPTYKRLKKVHNSTPAPTCSAACQRRHRDAAVLDDSRVAPDGQLVVHHLLAFLRTGSDAPTHDQLKIIV